jgi:hypothetical protein
VRSSEIHGWTTHDPYWLPECMCSDQAMQLTDPTFLKCYGIRYCPCTCSEFVRCRQSICNSTWHWLRYGSKRLVVIWMNYSQYSTRVRAGTSLSFLANNKFEVSQHAMQDHAEKGICKCLGAVNTEGRVRSGRCVIT